MTPRSSSPAALRDRIEGAAEPGKAVVAAPLTNYGRVEVHRKAIEAALPVGAVTAQRYIRAVQTLVKRPETHLAECTPESFLGAVVTLAQLGLEPGPLNLSYLEARKNNSTGRYEARPGIQYRGYVERAGRSGRLVRCGAYDVHEGDEFEFDQATGHLSHRWDLRAARGPVYAHYAVAALKGGGRVSVVMSCADCEEYRRYSQLGKKTAQHPQGRGPWANNTEAMHRKSTFLRLEPWLPKSSEMALAFATDGHVVPADPETAEPEPPAFDYEAEVVEDDDEPTPTPVAGADNPDYADGGHD